jgi:hypothetical protein
VRLYISITNHLRLLYIIQCLEDIPYNINFFPKLTSIENLCRGFINLFLIFIKKCQNLRVMIVKCIGRDKQKTLGVSNTLQKVR